MILMKEDMVERMMAILMYCDGGHGRMFRKF